MPKSKLSRSAAVVGIIRAFSTKYDVYRATSDGNCVDLFHSPPRRPVRIFEALKKEIEVVVPVWGKHRDDVKSRDQIRNRHEKSPSADLVSLHPLRPQKQTDLALSHVIFFDSVLLCRARRPTPISVCSGVSQMARGFGRLG